MTNHITPIETHHLDRKDVAIASAISAAIATILEAFHIGSKLVSLIGSIF